MSAWNKLLVEIENCGTYQEGVTRLIDGIMAAFKAAQPKDLPRLSEELSKLRPSLFHAITVNTSHVAVDPRTAEDVQAIALAVNRPQLLVADEVLKAKRDLDAIMRERDEAIIAREMLAQEHEALKQSAASTQQELLVAYTQIGQLQTAHEQQAAQVAAVLEMAQKGVTAAEQAAAAATAALAEARKPAAEAVEPAKE